MKIGDYFKVQDTDCLITHINPDKTVHVIYVNEETRQACAILGVPIETPKKVESGRVRRIKPDGN